MGVERVHRFLADHGIAYESQRHPRAYGAQEVAAAEHVTGYDVAKPVLLKAGNDLVMVVLPAPLQVDLDAARAALGTDVELATETEFTPLFPDCEAGAEPVFGNLYGLRVYLDRSLADREHMVFRDGSHEETLEIAVADFIRAVEPEMVDIGVLPPGG